MMNEQLKAQHELPRSGSLDSLEFVIIDCSGEDLAMQLPDSTIEAPRVDAQRKETSREDLATQTPEPKKEGQRLDTQREETPQEETLIERTPPGKTPVDEQAQHKELSRFSQQKSAQTNQQNSRSTEIEYPNPESLNEGNIILVDPLQRELLSITGANKSRDDLIKPPRRKNDHPSFEKALTEPNHTSEKSRSCPPRITEDSESERRQQNAVLSKLKTSAGSLSHNGAGNLDGACVESLSVKTSKETQLPRSKIPRSKEFSELNHRSANRFLCRLCLHPVTLNQPFTVELFGSFYHKCCLADLCFTGDDLRAALRARRREKLRQQANRKKSPAWRRFLQNLRMCLKFRK